MSSELRGVTPTKRLAICSSTSGRLGPGSSVATAPGSIVVTRTPIATPSWRRDSDKARAAYLCSALALWAQASDSQTDEANKSWTPTTDSHSDNADPIRTIESHTQSGNRTVDMQSVQRRGSDGHFEPYQDIEKETVQVDAATVRTITRTFGRDADGAKTLVEVIEEEKHILPGGGSNIVR